jgi:hypothetical protein
MKSRSEIWFALLEETGRACSVSTLRDRKTVEQRVAAEGDNFFTITLPAYHKDLITSLSMGEIPSDAFVGFSRRRAKSLISGSRGVPEFLGGFLDQLFTSEVGRLEEGEVVTYCYTNPVLRKYDLTDVEFVNRMELSLKALRQLTLLFSKEKALCDDQKVVEAIAEYVKTDEDVKLPLWMSEETAYSLVDFSRMLKECYVFVSEEHYRLLTERYLTVRSSPNTVQEQLPINGGETKNG